MRRRAARKPSRPAARPESHPPAGRPILSALDNADLADVVLVVTRYFGGTKLGTGGLARAYGDAARAGMVGLRALDVELAHILHITYVHPDTGFVNRALAAARALVRSTRYDDRVHLEAAVAVAACEPLRIRMPDGTAGRIEVGDTGESAYVRAGP